MVPDGGSGSWEPQRSIPQRSTTKKESEVISAYRAFMKAVQTAQAAPTGFLGIGFDLDISISEEFSSDERILLEQVRSGNKIVTATVDELAETLGAENRTPMTETPENALTINFGTAAILSVIDSALKTHPLKPMSPDEKKSAIEGMRRLKDKVDALNAEAKPR